MCDQDRDCVELFAHLVGIVLENVSPTTGMVEGMLTEKYLFKDMKDDWKQSSHVDLESLAALTYYRGGSIFRKIVMRNHKYML